jgi:hypothetical protein
MSSFLENKFNIFAMARPQTKEDYVILLDEALKALVETTDALIELNKQWENVVSIVKTQHRR